MSAYDDEAGACPPLLRAAREPGEGAGLQPARPDRPRFFVPVRQHEFFREPRRIVVGFAWCFTTRP
ncbi:hypothetical protein VK92_02200 [Burkholderia sp. LK4]|uniref:Uncharacterized protein n=1 Tax=Burkholderia reimsis TaxID=2234132 RepID=A0A365R244_9BURK|nr:hypothetical protein VL00_27155 [Burkholderia cepacia]KMN62552.1 hypothetical protein VK92_02200 [Burkholderia sp. LK4]RBB42768.1 hypothetical protein DPV79_00115 [Burkholderia reimsis]